VVRFEREGRINIRPDWGQTLKIRRIPDYSAWSRTNGHPEL